MEQLRAQYNVHALIREREGQGIAAHGVREAMSRGGEKTKRPVYANGTQGESSPPGNLTSAPGNVSEAGADVQEGGGLTVTREVIEDWAERKHRRASAAEEKVRPLHVAVRAFARRRVDARTVENLVAGVVHRSSCAYPPR
jgi:hypothetical protein